MLANGLRVLVVEDGSFPLVAVTAWVGAGSRHEPAHLQGGSHFLEHMVSRGTRRRKPLQDRMDIIVRGGRNGADTYYDRTQYYNVVERHHFLTAVDVLADVTGQALLAAPEICNEKRVVSEELRLELDTASTMASHGLMRAVFGEHPYGRPVIGTLRSVARLRRDDLVAYYESHYVPSNMVVAVVGDVRADTAVDAIATAFDRASPRRAPRPPAAASLPRPGDFRTSERRSAVAHEPIMNVGFRMPGYRHPDRVVFDILNQILGASQGRLSEAGCNRSQLARYLTSWYLPLAEHGVLNVVGAPYRAADFDALKRIVWEELVRLREVGVSEAELQTARQRLQLTLLFGHEALLEQAKQLAEAELFGDVRYHLDYERRLAAVTTNDVERVARAWLVAENAVGFDLLPLQRPARAPVERKATERARQSLSAGRWKPPAKAVSSNGQSSDAVSVGTPRLAGRQPMVRFMLDNGLRVVLLRLPRLPMVSMTVKVEAGSAHSKRAGLAELTAMSLLYGGWRFKDEQVRRRLSRWGSRYQMEAGREITRFSLSVERGVAAEALALAGDIFVHPTFYEAEVAAAIRGQKTRIERSADEPRQVLFRAWRRRMYGAHAYGRPVEGTATDAEALDRAQVTAFHEAWYRPERGVVTLVGDVSEDEARTWVEAAFGGWVRGNSDDARTMPRWPEPRARPGHELMVMPRQQAYLLVGTPAVSFNHAHYWGFEVLASMLGIRMFVDLTYHKSIAYESNCVMEAFSQAGAFYVYLSTRAAEAERGHAELVDKLRQIANEPVSAAELKQTQQLMIGRRAMDEQNTRLLAEKLARWELLGPGALEYETSPSRIREVTVRGLRALAEAYFDSERLVAVTVAPA